MEPSRLGWFTRTERRHDALVILLWTVSIAAVYMRAIYQQASTSLYDYLVVIGICIVAGIALADLGRALLAYLTSIAAAMAIVFFLTVLPALDGAVMPPGDQTVVALWISILAKMIFPAQFISFLVASLIGSLIGERYS